MSSLTQLDLVRALKELLPPLDPTTVTFSRMLEDLANHFGVEKRDLKTHHKEEIKQIIPDLIHLCKGGVDKENESENEQRDEEHEEEEPVAKKQLTKRSRAKAIEESDEGNSDGDDEDDDDASANSEEIQPKKQKKASSVKKAKPTATKRKTTLPARAAADKAKESSGMVTLKELARVAGLLNPSLYAQLKKLNSEEEREDALRERLEEYGVCFTSPYPTKGDIAAAKRKKDKERELDGIDSSLIITGGRPRRSAAKQPSFTNEPDNGEEEENEEEEQQDDNDDESEAHDESDGSEESEAEF